VRIRDGVGGVGGDWFGESVTRRVGDGLDTFFWSDPWLGGAPLCERFGGCMTWLRISRALLLTCFLLGGRVEARRGCGGGSCGCGRRRC
jgi:hypothetical protein